MFFAVVHDFRVFAVVLFHGIPPAAIGAVALEVLFGERVVVCAHFAILEVNERNHGRGVLGRGLRECCRRKAKCRAYYGAQGGFHGGGLRFFAENGSGKLIRTGCWLASAGVAEKLCRDFFGGHAFAELCDCLEVAVAAAGKADVANLVTVASELNGGGTCAFSLECFFHGGTFVFNYIDSNSCPIL